MLNDLPFEAGVNYLIESFGILFPIFSGFWTSQNDKVMLYFDYMKIGIDARMFSDSFTGIGRYNFELTKRFFVSHIANCQLPIEWVMFMNEPEYSKFHFPSHVRKVLVNASHYSFAEQWKFWRILEKEKCDLIHFTHFNAPLLYKGKFITTIHDTTISFYPGKKMNSWWRKLAYNRVIHHAIDGAEKIITVSDNTNQDVLKLFQTPKKKIVTIWNGIGEEFTDFPEIEKESIRQKFNLGKEFLLYTGNWREHKNLPRLIEAFGLILKDSQKLSGPKHLKDLKLVITGKKDHYYPEVEQTVKKLCLEESVKFIGLVTKSDLVRLYAAATVFVFPSLYEGFGLPPLESMQAGTPVVASKISSIPEICGEAVEYFDPHDVSDMSHAIIRVLTQEKLRETLVQKGFERVQHFSWDRAAEETLKVYKGVLKGKIPF